MSATKKQKNQKKKKNCSKDGGTKLIQDILNEKNISISEIETFGDINYPLFSFRYLNSISIEDCTNAKFFLDFLMRLQKLSLLGWNEIRTSNRHGFGMEPLPQSALVPDTSLLPKFITPEVELHVFRSNGDNRTFVGFQQGKIFHIFYIEAKHKDICKH